MKKIGVIRKEDIAALRDSIREGEIIEQKITLNRSGERLVIPIRETTRVVKKYPHLVEVERDREYPKTTTITYVDILVDRYQREEENGNV